MVATPGTIPALPPYQPGGLPLAGTEAVEIVNTLNATGALSYSLQVTDLVGKVPGVLPDSHAGPNDLIAFYQKSTGLPRSTPIGNIAGVVTGNLPVAGGAGTILSKNSINNFDASWVSISTLVSADGASGLTESGTTAILIGVATNAIGPVQFRQSVGLSIVGVAGTATANVADIVGVTDQVLRVAQNGTTLGFGAINLATSAAVTGVLAVVNGGLGTATLLSKALVIGNVTGAVGLIAAASSGVLTGLGTTTTPAYQPVNLASTSFVTGVLAVPTGGIGTATLPAHGVALGQGTTAVSVAAATTAGYLLRSAGSTSDPAYTNVGNVQGTPTNDNASAGALGEFVSATAALSAVSLATAVVTTVASATLSPGDWDVSSVVYFTPSALVTYMAGALSTSTTTLNTTIGSFAAESFSTAITAATARSVTMPMVRFSLASAATAYLQGFASFTTGTVSCGGSIQARRVR